MSENKHTPEHNPTPWRITDNPRQIVDAKGSTVAKLTVLDLPNARRIVDCVNACAGVTDEQFSGGWSAKGISEYVKSVEQQRDAMKRECDRHSAMHERLVVQRDELLAALEKLAEVYDAMGAPRGPSKIIADAAIANAKVAAA